MDFCIGRIEHYKMSSVNGVYRESSRELSRYPHSDVDPSLSKYNVNLLQSCRTGESPSDYIKRYKAGHNIKGRFNISGDNPKSQTNVMCQAFFKLPPAVVDSMSFDEVIQAYNDIQDWLRSRYPSIHIVGSFIHFDEPNAGVHMHVNFLPLHEQDGKIVFSTSKLFDGKDHFVKFQDDLHEWACEHFNYEFARVKDPNVKAKHLPLPEYKKAMRELECIQRDIARYEPFKAATEEIDSIGTPAMFGGYKVSSDDLNNLKQAAHSAVRSGFEIDRLRRENEDYRKRLDDERKISRQLSRKLGDIIYAVRKWFFQRKMDPVLREIVADMDKDSICKQYSHSKER